MTQRFGEDGRIERVTVLEAGPCPVTGIRTVERDGYEAVQLAFAPCKEKSITKAELGHLKKADAGPHRHVVEFRDEVGELLMGETVTVEAFSPGDQVKISGRSKGKGFQGAIKRLWVRISKCSRESLSLNGERITQYTFFSVGSGTGPETVAPVRVAVSTISLAAVSIAVWS